MQDKRLKILWLSDIHFTEFYKKGSSSQALEDYISSFLEQCSDIDIDYILLSGDIAQSGTKKQYDLFVSRILAPLRASNGGVKVLVCPGNHDVNRKDAEFLINYITKGDPDNSINKKSDAFTIKSSKKGTYFQKKKTDMERIFSDYSATFNPILKEIYGDTYKGNALHGYYVDQEKKVVFIILNSAWLSIGDKFIETYFKKYVNLTTGDFRGKIENVSVFFNHIRALVEEYGKQTVGLDIFPNLEELRSNIEEKYSGFFIMTVMHHPINWLNWADRQGVGNEPSLFNDIKNVTDLLISGHEHKPASSQASYLREKKLLHLEAGCFMDRQEADIFEVRDNWYSILEINLNKRSVHQTKRTYTGKWEEKMVPRNLRRKLKMKLSDDFKRNCIKSIRSLVRQKKIINNTLHIVQSKYGNIAKSENSYATEDDILYLFVVGTERKSWTKYENCVSLDQLELIKEKIMEGRVSIVKFVFVDLLFDKENRYSKSRDKDIDFQYIADIIQFMFDKFRSEFFSSLEPDDARAFKDHQFVCSIFNFWDICEY